MLCRLFALAALGVGALLGSAALAMAHPHVFAESRMEIVGTPDGRLAAVRNVWRMDELFSSSVVFDFDKNGNGTLDEEELAAVGATVRDSIAEWGFYTFVKAGSRDVKMMPPDQIRTLFENNQLLMFFEMKPGETVDLRKDVTTFVNFDDSFFTAFAFVDPSAVRLVDMPAGCSVALAQPRPDAQVTALLDSLSSLGPDQSVPDDGIDYSQMMSEHAEVRCG